MTDSSAVPVVRYTFDPWGRREVVTGADATSTGYTTHQWQNAAALWLSMYRGYDPALGRWISEDPLGIRGSINRHDYVSNRPIKSFDPFGLQSIECRNCNKEQEEAAKRAGKQACTNVGQSGGRCRAVLDQHGVRQRYEELCRDGFKVVCIKKGEDAGGCGGPSSMFSDAYVKRGYVFLQPNAFIPHGLCGSLANTVAHELAHSAGIGDGDWRRDPRHADNKRKAEEIAHACAGER